MEYPVLTNKVLSLLIGMTISNVNISWVSLVNLSDKDMKDTSITALNDCGKKQN